MNTHLHRRHFLGGAAGMTLVLTLTVDPRNLVGQALAGAPFAPNVWLTISPDGSITIVSPASELGQGTSTTLPAVIADELDADWSKIKFITPPGWSDVTHGNPGWGQNFNTTSSLLLAATSKPCAWPARRHAACCSRPQPRNGVCRSPN
jgi:isoquinoline 1-oxidoreductase beta subunit